MKCFIQATAVLRHVFLCGILAGQNFDTSITGDASIQKRPMGRVVQPLSMMGAKIENEYCPLYITGTKLHGIDYKMPVASAQVKTAIILAGLYADGETVIHEIEKSRDHTELMLSAMGADLTVDNLDITVKPTNDLTAVNVDVPGDISSAAFFFGTWCNYAELANYSNKCRYKPYKNRYY